MSSKFEQQRREELRYEERNLASSMSRLYRASGTVPYE